MGDRVGRVLVVLLLGIALAGPGRAGDAEGIGRAVDRLLAADRGLDLAVAVSVPGRDAPYGRHPEEPRPAASAIKSFIALDLLRQRGGELDTVPAGVEFLLIPGSHPAFDGFRPEGLAAARARLTGKTWLELAEVMMGRIPAGNETYNAACNVLMVKLGGPEAIDRRLADLGFADVELDRYMFQWDGDDNRVSPAALVRLYGAAAAGRVPGLDAAATGRFRALLLEGEDAEGSRYGKTGTLYPRPMTRVRAGWYERGDADIVYAIMGTMAEGSVLPPPDAFVFLLAAVDTLAAMVRDVP